MPPRLKYLHLETTSHCNACCNFCAHPTMQRKKEHMSDEVFSKVLEDIRPWFRGTIWPFFNGEFLCDPKIWERMDALSALPIKFGIHTNAAALTEERLQRMAKYKYQGIMVSVNATSTAQHKERMGLECWDRVLAFTKRIELVLGVRPSMLFTDDLPTAECRQIAEKCNAELQMAYRYTWRGRVESDNDAIPNGPCLWVYGHVFILSNGDLVPCCMDLEGEGRLGNVMTDEIQKTYNEPALEKYRQQTARSVPLCENCNMPPR